MSFQLSVAARVPVPVGAAPLANAAPHVAASAIDADDTPFEPAREVVVAKYHQQASNYLKRAQEYESIDLAAYRERQALNARALEARDQFVRIGAKLAQLQDDYARLNDHDGDEHERREIDHELLAKAYTGLSIEERADEFKPTTFRSMVELHDTSRSVRDAGGKLTGPITAQAGDRAPDWLPVLADVASAVVEGWEVASGGKRPRPRTSATNCVSRSRTQLVEKVCQHAGLCMNETWKPVVTLAPGEQLIRDVSIAPDWTDMLDDNDVAAALPAAYHALVDDADVDRFIDEDEEVAPVEIEGEEEDIPVGGVPFHEELGGDGLELFALGALAETGAAAEDGMAAKKKRRADDALRGAREADLAARVQRLSMVACPGVSKAWFQ